MLPFERPDHRKEHELRHIKIEPNFAPHANGSVLVSFENTKVICAVTIERKLPRWMIQQKLEGGWLSAEYSMLPYSTHERKQREVTRGKQEGRTVEIQRLIGRSLRAVMDLKKIAGYTLWVDCDVLQADGGTRTAAITGAYVAAKLAIKRLIDEGSIKEDPFTDSVSAISVGVVQGTTVVDLNYLEDKDAQVDANVIMTGSGRFVEVQMSGEDGTFTPEQMSEMLALATKGTEHLKALQESALKLG